MNIEIKFSNGNLAPEKMTLLTEEEFAKSKFFVFGVKSIEYRYVIRFKDDDDLEKSITEKVFEDSLGNKLQFNCYIETSMLWVDDFGGVAIVSTRNEGRVHFFSFGCTHKSWRSPTEEEMKKHHLINGMCIHNAVCKDCGFVQTLDSSD